MSKNSFQDMIKIKTVSGKMDDVRPSSRPKVWEKDIDRKSIEKKEEPVFEAREYYPDTNKNNGSKYGLWFVALVSVVFLFFALSSVFAKAKITINPKSQDIALNQTFSAIKNSNDAALSFDLVVISGDETRSLKGTERKDISTQAKGKVLLYNAFSTVPQKLSINTRLEGSNGQIYKTEKEIIVPGVKADGNPGAIEVDIYADSPGEIGNTEPIDFKIFGFKGTLKYDKFYGRAVGAVSGGQIGNFSVLSEEQKTAVSSELEIALKDKLFKKVTDQIPEGFVLFKDSVFVVNDALPENLVSVEDDVAVTLKGTLYGFLFNEKKLLAQIAEKNIDRYVGEEIFAKMLENLNFSLADRESISFADATNINFTLTGPLKVVWKFDSNKIIKEVLGKSKKDFNQILASYPNIDSAELILRPFWKKSFPEKEKSIKVIINEL